MSWNVLPIPAGFSPEEAAKLKAAQKSGQDEVNANIAKTEAFRNRVKANLDRMNGTLLR